jgi:hypothetical protein
MPAKVIAATANVTSFRIAKSPSVVPRPLATPVLASRSTTIDEAPRRLWLMCNSHDHESRHAWASVGSMIWKLAPRGVTSTTPWAQSPKTSMPTLPSLHQAESKGRLTSDELTIFDSTSSGFNRARLARLRGERDRRLPGPEVVSRALLTLRGGRVISAVATEMLCCVTRNHRGGTSPTPHRLICKAQLDLCQTTSQEIS